MQQLKYLGNIATDSEKIKLYGFVNHYRKFVENYSEKSHKLEYNTIRADRE